jgi:hypothetical protein
MNNHNKDWQLAFEIMFQMPFLFILDPKARSFFQLIKFVLIYLITLFQQENFCTTRSYCQNEQNSTRGQKL